MEREQGMSVEILPALHALAEGWVVKKDPSIPPQRLVPEDFDQLARASVETMIQRALGYEGSEWGSLERLTRGWVVQRERGEAPAPLNDHDYRKLVRFVLEGLAQDRIPGKDSKSGKNPDATSNEVPLTTPEALLAYVPETDERLPDGRLIADVLKEDPFYFAREHLAQSL